MQDKEKQIKAILDNYQEAIGSLDSLFLTVEALIGRTLGEALVSDVQEQETDFPFIRLWGKLWEVKKEEIQERLVVARNKNLTRDTVFDSGFEERTIHNLSEAMLRQMLRKAVEPK